MSIEKAKEILDEVKGSVNPAVRCVINNAIAELDAVQEAQREPECRKCGGCKDSDHHWLDQCDEETGEPITICKHCPATKPYESGIEPLWTGKPIEGDIEDESEPSEYCSGCFGKTIHHTCGKEPDADKVQAMQSGPEPGDWIKEVRENLRLVIQARPLNNDERNLLVACGFIERKLDHAQSKPEPGEFTAKCCHPGVNPQKFDKLSWREVLCDLACPLIDRQAKQLKDKHTISKEGTEDG